MPFRKRFLIPVFAATFFAAAGAQAQVTSQLGVVDPNSTNPATGSAWQAGDTYHLVFITNNAIDGTSTDIADYNAFVQSEADTAGYGSVNWFAMGSTADTDAIDNAPITGPVFNIADESNVGLDEADFYDLDFSNSGSPTQLDGSNKNLFTGTLGGGTAHAGEELGAEDGTTRIAWSGWSNWSSAWRAEDNTNAQDFHQLAVSQELTMVPEPTSLALLGLGGLLVARRRRG